MRKIILIIVLFCGLIILGYFLFFGTGGNNSNKIETLIEVAPKKSSIILDGKKIKAGKHLLEIGQHNIKVSYAGFNDYSQAFEVSHKNPSFIIVGLKPNSDEGGKYFQTHKEEFINLEHLSERQLSSYNQKAEKEGQLGVQKYPLIKELPVVIPKSGFRIDYGVSKKYPGDSSEIAIYIGSNTPQHTQDALNLIKTMGYELSDYEIIFQPLEQNNEY